MSLRPNAAAILSKVSLVMVRSPRLNRPWTPGSTPHSLESALRLRRLLGQPIHDAFALGRGLQFTRNVFAQLPIKFHEGRIDRSEPHARERPG